MVSSVTFKKLFDENFGMSIFLGISEMRIITICIIYQHLQL